MGFLEVVSGLLCLIVADEFVPQLELMYLSSYRCHQQLKEVFLICPKLLYSISIMQCNT